jgi:hypothetical protein
MVCKLLLVSYNANHAFARFVGYGEKVLIEQKKAENKSKHLDKYFVLLENRTQNLLSIVKD